MKSRSIPIRGIALLAVLLVAFPFFSPSPYVYDLAIRIAMSSVVVVGLNLLFGYTGQISLGHAAFYGIGAYASAILTTRGLSAPLGLVAGAAVSGVIAAVVSRPVLKLSGHHLAMATLALGLIFAAIFNNEVQWTGGSDGMTVPAFGIGGWDINGEVAWYAVSAGLLFLVVVASVNLVNSPAGRALQAIRGSEIAARVAGVDTARFKSRVFVLSAVLTSVVGSLSAHYVAFLTPASAGLVRSVEFLMMVVLGGMASVFGSIAGAALITLLPQVLHAFGSWETLVLGLILTSAMIFMPGGIVPTLRSLLARRGLKTAGSASGTRTPSSEPTASGAQHVEGSHP